MLHHRLRGMQRNLILSYVQQLAFTSSTWSSFSATPQAGDLLIYLAGGTTSGLFVADPTHAIPVDFTQICTHNEGNLLNSFGGRTTIAYKIANGTETDAYGTSKGTWHMSQFRATRPIATVNVIDTDGAWSTGDPASKTLDAPGGLPALAVGVYHQVDSTIPTLEFYSTNQPTAVAMANGTYLRGRYIIYSSTGYTLSVNMNDVGNLQGYSAAVLTVE